MSVENQARSVSVYVIYDAEAWSLRNLAPQASSEQWLGSDCKNHEIRDLALQIHISPSFVADCCMPSVISAIGCQPNDPLETIFFCRYKTKKYEIFVYKRSIGQI
jgi:hypothetical protein